MLIARSGLWRGDDLQAMAAYARRGPDAGVQPRRPAGPGLVSHRLSRRGGRRLRGAQPLCSRRGWEGRNPGPWFDAGRYMALRGDHLRADVDPLTDYLHGGAWTVVEPLVSEAGDPRLTPLEHWASQSDDEG